MGTRSSVGRPDHGSHAACRTSPQSTTVSMPSTVTLVSATLVASTTRRRVEPDRARAGPDPARRHRAAVQEGHVEVREQGRRPLDLADAGKEGEDVAGDRPHRGGEAHFEGALVPPVEVPDVHGEAPALGPHAGH